MSQPKSSLSHCSYDDFCNMARTLECAPNSIHGAWATLLLHFRGNVYEQDIGKLKMTYGKLVSAQQGNFLKEPSIRTSVVDTINKVAAYAEQQLPLKNDRWLTYQNFVTFLKIEQLSTKDAEVLWHVLVRYCRGVRFFRENARAFQEFQVKQSQLAEILPNANSLPNMGPVRTKKLVAWFDSL